MKSMKKTNKNRITIFLDRRSSRRHEELENDFGAIEMNLFRMLSAVQNAPIISSVLLKVSDVLRTVTYKVHSEATPNA